MAGRRDDPAARRVCSRGMRTSPGFGCRLGALSAAGRGRVDNPRPAVEFLGEFLPHPRVVAGKLHDDPDAMRGQNPNRVGQLGLADGVDVQQPEYALSPFGVAQRRVAQQLLDGGGWVGWGRGPGAGCCRGSPGPLGWTVVLGGGAAVTGSAVTGSAVTGSAVTGSAVTGSAVTGSAVTGSAVTGSAVTRIRRYRIRRYRIRCCCPRRVVPARVTRRARGACARRGRSPGICPRHVPRPSASSPAGR